MVHNPEQEFKEVLATFSVFCEQDFARRTGEDLERHTFAKCPDLPQE